MIQEDGGLVTNCFRLPCGACHRQTGFSQVRRNAMAVAPSSTGGRVRGYKKTAKPDGIAATSLLSPGAEPRETRPYAGSSVMDKSNDSCSIT
jgi:hypothetical protein